MRILYTILLSTLISYNCSAQFKIMLNGWVDLELSKGDSTSHYYYNEIHKDYKDWRFSPASLNVLTEVKWKDEFSLNLRGQIDRDSGGKFDQIGLPLCNIKYQNTEKNWALTLGRFVNPFGSFAEKQHSKERTFINLPLAFSYHTNISSKVGFAERMGESKFKVDEEVQWGSTLLYYGAYNNGVLFEWTIKPDLINWKFSLNTNSPNILLNDIGFSNYGLTSRIELQPKYFWEQGFSISHGSFYESSEFNGLLENYTFNQSIIGTDWSLGIGFWEISGELMGGLYQVPEFNPEEMNVESSSNNLNFLSTYINLKYEAPFLSGLYLAYGIDYLSFGKIENASTANLTRWDDAVLRHNFGLGYKINAYSLFRLNYQIQDVTDHPVWALNSWRAQLTIFM